MSDQKPAESILTSDLPVRHIPGDDARQPRPGVALCLSGGGYRAMMFHLGALWRLNEAGLLPQLQRISSVSGGSITAGVLGCNWSGLGFDRGIAANFASCVVDPLRALAGTTIDIPSVLEGLFTPSTVADKVVEHLDDRLFHASTLQDLPDDPPRFVINATSVQAASLWRFSKPYMGDWRVGLIDRPALPLAVAVAASAAFPPFLSPLHLDLRDFTFRPTEGAYLTDVQFKERTFLADGGVYDNLGLETAWKNYQTVLVSDGGLNLQPQPAPHGEWPRHAMRVMDLIDNQVRSLRKRQVIGSFTRPLDQDGRQGAYWSIRSHVKDYPTHILDCPMAASLAAIDTRLAALGAHTQERLINWGYAICDTDLRSWVEPKLPASAWPYRETGC